MKRKESKIPLVLTVLVLAYFVFWAIGYVNRNKPVQAPVQLEAKAPEQVAPAPTPQPVVVQQPLAMPPPSPTPEVAVAPKQKPSEELSEHDPMPDGSAIIGGKVITNRKIVALVRDLTAKH
jgi:hypothetical protein